MASEGNATHEQYLMELTGLPTASGKEDRAIAWVEKWAKKRRNIELRRDQFGNLLLQRKGAASRTPIVFAAHMDHPAFVVTAARDGQTVEAEFRGGVADSYFLGTPVLLHHGKGEPALGVVTEVSQPESNGGDKRVVVKLETDVAATPGDVMTWEMSEPEVLGGRLYALACDDLAGVAAAIATLETLLADRKFKGDVRVLLTRAEEVGFVGAIAACRSGILPKKARIVALENSKSFAESPIGLGPIVRVGDRTSTFDPDLTYRIGKIAEGIAAEDAGFLWQRKLMPGGTCEASAYQALGYQATCVCLPLANYHNMNEETRRIDAESIAIPDYHGLIRLLVRIGQTLDEAAKSPPLKTRLDAIFAQRKGLLGGDGRASGRRRGSRR